ncbi:MAG: methyltransferase, TIGR04325 family [Hyphomicrobiales bacterium]|jgi:putative methyltransferase (TIGR04325 family)
MNVEAIKPPLRVRQVRLTGAALNWMSRLAPARRVINFTRVAPGFRSLYRMALGYQRSYRTLEEAEAAVSAYAQHGHQNPANADLHLTLNKRARPSDYAALFHLQRLLPNIRSIFDLGGNVGNLYYCYSEFFPEKDLIWTVHDLPENVARGRALAQRRGADRLSFADTWREASGVDLLLISGALHYLKQPLAGMLATLETLPRYILINRTPVTNGPSFAAVQDSGPFRVACLVRNRQALLKDLEGAGYRLLDTWHAAELALQIPGDHDHTVPFYSGFLLEHDPASVATQSGQEIRAED